MTRTLTAVLVAEIRAIARWPGWYALQSRTKARVSGRTTFSACWLLAAICLSGCTGSTALGPVAEADQTATIPAATASPRLQAGERIRVTVYGEASLSGDYQVDPSGFVSLPLAGTVKAEGLTQSELERELTKKFRSEYLRNPKVTVSVVEFRPFYIMGEIQKPGAYPYSSGLNILRAIAIAGGTTYRASKSTVEIQRAGQSDMREYPLAASIAILPGDTIRIPQRYF
jgi:polysaccharide export outer membrane protein